MKNILIFCVGLLLLLIARVSPLEILDLVALVDVPTFLFFVLWNVLCFFSMYVLKDFKYVLRLLGPVADRSAEDIVLGQQRILYMSVSNIIGTVLAVLLGLILLLKNLEDPAEIAPHVAFILLYPTYAAVYQMLLVLLYYRGK